MPSVSKKHGTVLQGIHLLYIIHPKEGISHKEGLDGAQFMSCLDMTRPIEGSSRVLPHHVMEGLQSFDFLGSFGIL